MNKLSLPSVRERLRGSESEQHIRAKHRLARWLAAASAAGEMPPFEVSVEYPFSERGDGVEAWSTTKIGKKPSFRLMRARHMPVFYVCDIVLIEGDRVTTAIEVVHGHYTPPWKADWLKAHGIAVYEAHASVIMAVKGRPATYDDIMVEVAA